MALATGHTGVQACRTLGITEHTASRWRTEDGGLTVEQATRLKDLEREHARLKRAVADVTLDTLRLTEAAEGPCSAQRGAAGG